MTDVRPSVSHVLRHVVALVVFAGALIGRAEAAAPDVFYNYFTTPNGTEVWTAPGPVVSSPGAGAARSYAGSAAGELVTDVGAVATKNGATVAFTAKRLISPANLFAAAKFMAGWKGAAALLAIGAFDDWLNSTDAAAQGKLRINNGAIQKNDACTVGPCTSYQFRTAPASTDPATACAGGIGMGQTSGYGWATYIAVAAFTTYSCSFTTNQPFTTGPLTLVAASVPPVPPAWYTISSMDDISQYMTPRPAPDAYVPAMTDAGVSFDAVPAPAPAITGPASAPPSVPVVQDERPAVPAPVTTTRTVPGNPSNLPNNTPTTTSSSTGSTPVTTPSGKIGQAPTHTTETSTYDPVANSTRVDTTTATDPIKVVTSTTTTQNFTYNQTSVTNNVVNTSVTTITNLVTNTVIGTPNTSTATPTPTPDPADPCKQNPDSMGCAKFGSPVAGDPIAHDTKAISITPVVFAGGSCPAPVSFSAFNRSYSFSYSDLCARLAALSTLFLALAGLGAAYIFTNGFKV